MKRGIVMAVMLALVGFGVRAQDDSGASEWRLRVPTTEEYVENATEIIGAAETIYTADFYNNLTYLAEGSALTDEMEWRLVENHSISYAQLNAIYQAYKERQSNQIYQPITDYNWILKLLALWLTENPTDLSKQNELQFDVYRIQITPLTGNFNGRSEVRWGYWLQIAGAPNVRNGNIIAIQDEDGAITFPELPASIDGNLLAWGRINDDEYPDIAYLNSTHMGNSYNSGTVIIASLRGDHFETISGLGYSEGATFALPPEDYTWQFIQLDNKPDFEVVQNQRLHDNWGCAFIEVSLFEWNDEGKLVATSRQNILPQSFNCLLVQAEKAIWKHEYAQAIDFYEKALGAKPVDQERSTFARMRLGLAYLLTEQGIQAKIIFTTLDTSNNAFAKAVQHAYENDPHSLAVCQATYNFAAENPYPNILTTTGTWKSYDGGFYGFGSGDPGFSLQGASCDLSDVLDDFLAKTSFDTSESPVEQLKATGLKADNSIAEDFDQDGKQEWLVWLSSIGIDPIFFYPDGEVYQISRLKGHGDIAFRSADLRLPDAYNQYSIVTLPDGIGKALVDVDFSEDKYAIIQCAGVCGGGPSYVCAEHYPDLPDSPGDLTLWRVENGTLINFVFTPLCNLVTVKELFPDGEGSKRLVAADYIPVDPRYDDVEAVAATYFWDSAAKTYALPPKPMPTATSVITVTATPVPPYVETFSLNDNSLIRVRNAFKNRDFEQVEQITDSALSQPSESQPTIIFAFQYYRALALEALNRPNEALKEYVSIYEAAPESAWGMLAGLHLELVEGK